MSSLEEALEASPTATYEIDTGSMTIRRLSENLVDIRLTGLSEGSMTLQEVMDLLEQLGIPSDQGWSAETNE